jgi:hypothetical protein
MAPKWLGRGPQASEQPGLPKAAGQEGVAFSAYGTSIGVSGALAPYIVHLLLDQPRAIDASALAASITTRSGLKTQVVGDESAVVQVAFPEVLAHLKDATVPMSVSAMALGAKELTIAEPHKPSLLQTFGWDGAGPAVESASHEVVVTDLMGGVVEPGQRFRAYHAFLVSAVEQLKPVAIDWAPAQRIVNPVTYVASAANRQATFSLMVNVRMIRIDGSRQEACIMDTMGMPHLGLPDLQIHFFGLEPGAVAGYLKNLAYYLYENGDVIEDGHTVEGLAKGERWHCRREGAIIGPARVVLDINPGRHRPKS